MYRDVVVVADDMGYAHERDEGIVHAYQHGIITQSSLLVTGPSAKEAIQKARTAKKDKKLYISHHKHKIITTTQTEQITSDDNTTHTEDYCCWMARVPVDKSMKPSTFLSSSSFSSSSLFPTTLQSHTGIPLGLHFNLTEGRCLHVNNNNNEEDGMMLGKQGFWDASKRGEITKKYVRDELIAQLDWFVMHVGYLPTHVDGHNHIHVLPVVSIVLAELLPRLGIRWIRVPTEKLVPDISSYLYADTQQAIMKEYHTHSAAAEGERREEEQQQEIEKKKRINEEEEKKLIPFSGAQRIFFEDVVQFAKSSRELWSSHGLHMTDYFIGCQLMGRTNTLTRCKAQIIDIPLGYNAEYMCHPGYPSQTGDDFSRSIDREWELDILCDSSWMNFARNTHTHFVSFSQLENLVDEKKNITETTNTILS